MATPELNPFARHGIGSLQETTEGFEEIPPQSKDEADRENIIQQIAEQISLAFGPVGAALNKLDEKVKNLTRTFESINHMERQHFEASMKTLTSIEAEMKTLELGMTRKVRSLAPLNMPEIRGQSSSDY